MTNIPRNNDKNTRIRRGMNTLREMNAERLPADNVCRCPRKNSGRGVRDSSDRREVRNSNAISDPSLRSNSSLISRIPDGDVRTRVAASSISSGNTSPAGEVGTLLCPPTLSTQMKWTFPGTVVDCPCLQDLVINMDWDSDLYCWKGSAAGCLGTIYCIMNESAGVATVGISGTDYATAIDNATGVSHTCSPFNATGNITSDQATVCGVVPSNAVPVNITER